MRQIFRRLLVVFARMRVAQALETDVSDAQIARDSFFGAGGAGEGYADSFAIGTAISGLETLEGQAGT